MAALTTHLRFLGNSTVANRRSIFSAGTLVNACRVEFEEHPVKAIARDLTMQSSHRRARKNASGDILRK
jgi:hypothetical protein